METQHNTLPREIWIDIMRFLTFVPYETDLSSSAHIRLRFRKKPLHLDARLPCVYKDKYTICRTLSAVSKCWSELIAAFFYSFLFIRHADDLQTLMRLFAGKPHFRRYVKGLIFTPNLHSTKSQITLPAQQWSQFPSLTVLHRWGEQPIFEGVYPGTLAVLDVVLYSMNNWDVPSTTFSTLTNLRHLTLVFQWRRPLIPSLSMPIELPALIGLDISDVRNPEIVLELAEWKMPKLRVLSIDGGLPSSTLTSFISSVAPTITALQLKLRNYPPIKRVSTSIPLPHLELLTLNIREPYRTQTIEDVLATCQPLPNLRSIGVAQSSRGMIRDRNSLSATLNMLCSVMERWKGAPKLSEIRIWENHQKQLDSLLDPVSTYRSIRNRAFHPEVLRRNIRFKVVAPSGKYLDAVEAFEEVDAMFQEEEEGCTSIDR